MTAKGAALFLGDVDAPSRLVHGESSELDPVLSLPVTFSVAYVKNAITSSLAAGDIELGVVGIEMVFSFWKATAQRVAKATAETRAARATARPASSGSCPLPGSPAWSAEPLKQLVRRVTLYFPA